MRFVFDDEKAAQAGAYLLKQAGGALPSQMLIQLLYLADRQSLLETGSPVTGAYMVSTRYGPSLSELFELVAGGGAESAWNRYMSPPSDHYLIKAVAEPRWDYLSEYDTELLDRIAGRYNALDGEALAAVMRALPEWRDPGRSMASIDVRLILQEAGFSDSEIQTVAEQAEAAWTFRALRAS